MPAAAPAYTLPRAYRDIPPLRPGGPFAPDPDDPRRVAFLRGLWNSQTHLLRDRDRQIEQHIRMLAGQHWTVWSELLGRWVDVTRYLSDEERRWRFLPVINRMLHWFMLLHARMTENPPVVAFQPATADRIDAELAEVMDTLWKILWAEASMPEVVDELFAWLIPAGQAHLKSRIDPLKGEPIEYVGPAVLSLLDGEGNPVLGPDGLPIERYVDAAPYGPDGNPRARLLPDGAWEATGQPHVEYEGAIVVDVLSPLEVRGQWGPRPWHEKAWKIHRSLLTPEEVWDAFGVDVAPTIRGQEAEEAGSLRRMLYGSGFFGAATGKEVFSSENGDDREYVEVLEGWFQPCRFPGMERTKENPGGRLMIIAGDRCIRDGARFAHFPYGDPIRTFKFVNVPGRPSGTSPAEMMVGPQKTYNRVTAQILQHSTLAANPITVVDTASGILEGTISNRPAQIVYAKLGGGYTGDPIRFASPPSLTQDVWRTQAHLREEMNDLGNIAGAQGTPPTMDSSGELVKELRFNSDRFVGPTMRRSVTEFARMAEDWQAMLPIIYDREKILRYAGDDQVATTITVLPQMFEQGKCNVVPDVESMLPEGRGERQARIWTFYQAGIFGPVGTPEATDRFLELARFPHMGRLARPGGVDRVMAEQNVGKLAQGQPAESIPVFEWYDHGIHLFVLERFMKSPEYLKLPPVIQQQFVLFRQILRAAQLEKLITDQQLQAAVAGAARQQAAAAGLLPADSAAAGGQPGAGAPPREGAPQRIEPGPPARGPTAAIPA